MGNATISKLYSRSSWGFTLAGVGCSWNRFLAWSWWQSKLTTHKPYMSWYSPMILLQCLSKADACDFVLAEAFASNHASQCGFCTPGFVVACHATLAKASEAGKQPTPEGMMQGLDGNLCRCTGYTTILDACKVKAFHRSELESIQLVLAH